MFLHLSKHNPGNDQQDDTGSLEPSCVAVGSLVFMSSCNLATKTRPRLLSRTCQTDLSVLAGIVSRDSQNPSTA